KVAAIPAKMHRRVAVAPSATICQFLCHFRGSQSPDGPNAGHHRPSCLATANNRRWLVRLYISAIRGKNVFPFADKLAWSKANQSVAFANEMRLIKISGLVDNPGPRLHRFVAMGRQGRVEPDRSRIKFGRKAHL